MAGVIGNYSKFEVHVVVRLLQAESEWERDSLHDSERLQPEGSVSVLQQI
jgi:hypothetical protein